MSWLRQSPSANSLHQDSSPGGLRKLPSGSLVASSSGAPNRHSQPPITRFLACGTVYITHTLSVPSSLLDNSQSHEIPHTNNAISGNTNTTSVRAKQVTTERGGSAVNVLSILAQFSTRQRVECALVSPLGSDAAGRALMHELELEGIRTRFCKLHPAGVPSAFVLQSDDTSNRTIINHNPLPELSHEDFISILGPILVPEHYQGLVSHHWHPHPSLPQPPPVHAVYGPGPGLPPISTPPYNTSFPPLNPIPVSTSQQPLPPSTPGLPSNAPFTIFHVTGRSQSADGITLENVTGVDGLAKDRLWRDKVAFSLDCTAPVISESAQLARQKIFQHVDVIFFSKAYALSVNPATPPEKLTPRSFLLSQVPLVASHALLLVHWDHDGGALLSVPTREYLQSSVWTDSEFSKPATEPISTPSSVPSANRSSIPPELRPETQLSLGSADPRYQDSTLKTIPNANDVLSEEMIKSPTSPSSSQPMSPPGAPGAATFDYGFAEAFANVTPDSSWDYRANRTAVIYDSGDDSEDTDYGQAVNANNANKGQKNLGLDMSRTNPMGASGVIISEGVALSPSDVDSDVDVGIAAVASRFVMEERMRRVYGPMEDDPVESDVLDLSSIENGRGEGNDSDVTEDGKQPSGPTRIGKLKKQKMKQKEEQDAEERRRIEEEEERARLEAEREEQEENSIDRASLKSEASPPKPKPPLPNGVIEAWQAGLLYALTRHVLPGSPYCPPVAPKAPKGKGDNSKSSKKLDSVEPNDWAWRWRLDECLRFAAELAGRRARKGSMEGLALEMENNGWF